MHNNAANTTKATNMNETSEISLELLGPSTDTPPQSEIATVCKFFSRRLLFHLPADDQASCTAFYGEAPIGVYVHARVTPEGFFKTRTALGWLSPAEAIPQVVRFVEIINQRLPKGRMEIDPQSGRLWLECQTQRTRPDVPLQPSVVEQHLAYACRIFVLLWELIRTVFLGQLDEAEMAECLAATWPVVELLLPHLAKDHIPNHVRRLCALKRPRVPEAFC